MTLAAQSQAVDPWGFPLTAAGDANAVDVSAAALDDAASGERCLRAFVTRRPDFTFAFKTSQTLPIVAMRRRIPQQHRRKAVDS